MENLSVIWYTGISQEMEESTVGDKGHDLPSYEELLSRNRELEERLRGHENREYKSRLFGFLFGREEHKEWTLALYNAINGTSHTDPADITINTIEDVVYLGMKNDLSILVSEVVSLYRTMELYEQQSTYNPNMPVREFMYAGKLYDSFIYMAKLHRYGKKLIPLPIPKLVVFYNGEDDQEDEVTLRLSDSFREEIRRGVMTRGVEGMTPEEIEAEVDRIYEKADPDIAVKVRMININYGHNRELLKACKPLEEYSWFIAKIREVNGTSDGDKPMSVEAAIDKAIEEMPDDFLIKGFIVENRAEVMDMCLTEYNEAETMEMFKEEGEENATVAHLKDIMESFGVTLEKAMDVLKIPTDKQNMYKGLL